MILRGWHIDGFGIFRDDRVDDLPQGVVVLYGPNEAGKSTLLEFIYRVLFGFPKGAAKKKVPLYDPLHGGQKGGRLFLESGGRRYTVGRREGGRSQAEITDDSGASVPEGDLTQLLGGADATLFRNVFGFTLSELQDLNSLTAEGVRDRIFSGAIAGAGKSARQAARDLEDAAGELYKADGRAKRNRVAELLGELRDLDRELDAARQAARAYPDKLAEEQQAEQAMAELKRQRDELQARQGWLERLRRLWDPWCDREQALQALDSTQGEHGEAFDRLEQIRPDPAFLDLVQRAEALESEVKLQADRLAKAERIGTELADARAELQQALASLGPEWTQTRVEAFTLPIPTREEVRGWDAKLRAAAQRADKAQERLAAAEQAVTQAQERADAQARELDQLGEEPPEIPVLQERRGRLEALQAKLAERDGLRGRAEYAEASCEDRAKRLADLERQRPPRAWLAIALGVALLATALGIWQAGQQQVEIAAVAGGVSLLAVVIAGWTAWSRARLATAIRDAEADHETARRARDQLVQQRDGLEDAIDVDARNLGLDLPSLPTASDLAIALSQTARLLDQRRHWEAKAQQARDAAAALAKARSERAQAQADLNTARGHKQETEAGWRAWKAERELPEALTPEGVMDFAARVAEAQKLAKRVETLAQSHKTVREEIAAWSAEAGAVLCRRGVAVPEDHAECVRAFTRELGALRAAKAHYDTVVRAEADLAREGGNDESRIAELRQALADGDDSAWQQELDELEGQAGELDQDYEAAVRRHQAARAEREAVEQSDAIAELETRRGTLAARIGEAYGQWQGTTLAQHLIEHTLDSFERERQPAVFERASEHLARITGDRYGRVLQDESGEGFVVLDARDRRLAPIDLSRGTKEQLYLAVRLGLVEEFGRRGTLLPLVLDEVLVNFDAVRMRAVAEELCSYGRTHQVLLFTCHDFVVETVQAADPSVTVVRLDRGGTARPHLVEA